MARWCLGQAGRLYLGTRFFLLLCEFRKLHSLTITLRILSYNLWLMSSFSPFFHMFFSLRFPNLAFLLTSHFLYFWYFFLFLWFWKNSFPSFFLETWGIKTEKAYFFWMNRKCTGSLVSLGQCKCPRAICVYIKPSISHCYCCSRPFSVWGRRQGK